MSKNLKWIIIPEYDGDDETGKPILCNKNYCPVCHYGFWSRTKECPECHTELEGV